MAGHDPVEKTWLGKKFDAGFKALARGAFRLFFRSKVEGLENFNKVEKDKPLVIIANHVSFFDAAMLTVHLPVDAAYGMDTEMHKKIMKNPILRFLMSRVKIHTIDPTKPQAIKSLVRLAQGGTPVIIFPEGRLTATGGMMQVFDGAAIIADKADALIVPVYLRGFENLSLGITRLKNTHPGRLLPNLSMTVLEPRKLNIPPDATRKQRRQQRHDKLEKIMHALPVQTLDKNTSLMDALHEAAKNYGSKRPILQDLNGITTYRDLLAGAYIIGDKLEKETYAKENVGLLMPTSNAAGIAFYGLQSIGRVPAMLNFKAEITDMLSYTGTASLSTIVTSRTFVEKAGLEKKIEALSQKCRIIYLEDLKSTVTFKDKVKGLLRAKGLLPRPKNQIKGEDPAVILFTSGSEGAPKGVVLSAANILSNFEQLSATAPFTPADKAFNAMPFFHAFGLIGGFLLPVLKGLQSFQYPSPLDGKNIPKAAYFFDTTILFGTDTFLSLYARRANDRDLSQLKMVFTGAEPMQQSTYDTYVERFGVVPNQGYGMTEAAPIVSMNVPGAHRKGTVGKFLPGIDVRLEPVEGIEEGGRLFVRGPNIMLGYLRNDNPGVIEPPADGWHDTGDIVSMTAEGYVKISGRAKRFAKIGGEMVSLDTIETIARAATQKPESEQAAILLQAPHQPDGIAIFTTDPDLKRDALIKAAQETGRAILGLPRKEDIHCITEMPKLPTGKTDYVSLKKLKDEFSKATKTAPHVATPPAPPTPKAPPIP